MKRFFIITLSGVALAGVAAGGGILAATAIDTMRAVGIAAGTLGLVIGGIGFLADCFFHIGREEGRAEAEAFRKGLRP